MTCLCAPVFLEDAVVDARLAKFENNRYPGLDMVHISNLTPVNLCFCDEAPELGLRELARGHGLAAHAVQKLSLVQGGARAVLFVSLRSYAHQLLLNGVTVRCIGLVLLLVFFLSAPLWREATGSNAL